MPSSGNPAEMGPVRKCGPHFYDCSAPPKKKIQGQDVSRGQANGLSELA